jgi:hypothetical protein
MQVVLPFCCGIVISVGYVRALFVLRAGKSLPPGRQAFCILFFADAC